MNEADQCFGSIDMILITDNITSLPNVSVSLTVLIFVGNLLHNLSYLDDLS